MSAASVLRSFSPSAMPGPVIQMDMAMRFYISHSSPPPLRGFLSSYEDLHRAKNLVNQSNNVTTATSRNTHSSHKKQQDLYKPLRPCLSKNVDERDEWNKSDKKRVVFADTKGMSLTAIHVFSKFDDEPYQNINKRGGVGGGCGIMEDLQFDMSDLEQATMDLKISSVRSLALDFKQPSADYLDFRNRLIQNSVCLENCSLQERSLTGTVKVRNIGFEKAVKLRATFDSWVSFTDVECTFMNNIYSCQDSDTFAFVLEMPAQIPPENRVEFCICFTVKDQIFWDNNDGKNYVLKHVGWNGEDVNKPRVMTMMNQGPVEQKKISSEHQKNCIGGGVKVLELDFDQFGSPRMSSGLFPGWQSWGQIDSAVPYW